MIRQGQANRWWKFLISSPFLVCITRRDWCRHIRPTFKNFSVILLALTKSPPFHTESHSSCFTHSHWLSFRIPFRRALEACVHAFSEYRPLLRVIEEQSSQHSGGFCPAPLRTILFDSICFFPERFRPCPQPFRGTRVSPLLREEREKEEEHQARTS